MSSERDERRAFPTDRELSRMALADFQESPRPKVNYRDYCNTCGAKRDDQHKPHCHMTGVVGAWSGITSSDGDENFEVHNPHD